MLATRLEFQPTSEHAEAIELSETLERECLKDLCQAAPSAVRTSLGWHTVTHGSAFATRCAARPDELMVNRVMGTPGAKDSEHWLHDAVALMQQTAQPASGGRWLLHPPPVVSSSAFEQELVALGFAPFRRRWAKFIRGRQSVSRVESPFVIQRADEHTVRDCGLCLVTHLALPIELAHAYSSVLGRAGWQLMVALDEGRVVASGALFMLDSVAYLAGAGTHVAYRKRGAQAALMAARLQLALDLGCRWVVAETGEAVAGEPNHSFNNMLKHGFEVVCSRANFVVGGQGLLSLEGLGSRPR